MRRMSSVKAAQRIPEPTWNATCGSFPLEAAAIPASAKHTSAPMPNPNIRARPLSKRRKRHREEPQPDVPQTDDVVKLVSPERVGKAERARSRFGDEQKPNSDHGKKQPTKKAGADDPPLQSLAGHFIQCVEVSIGLPRAVSPFGRPLFGFHPQD